MIVQADSQAPSNNQYFRQPREALVIDRTSIAAALARLAAELPTAELPELCADIERARAVAWSRLTMPAPKPEPKPLLLDAPVMAARAGVPETWLRARARRGEIRSVRCGHYVKFRETDVLEDLERLGATPQDGRSRRPGKTQQPRDPATALLPRDPAEKGHES